MKTSTKTIFAIVLLLIAGYFIVKPKLSNKKLEFTYTALKTGALEALVSSTGTLEAINTVEVGTQLSGTISQIYVDYNDQVTQGQLLAKMDTRLLETNLLTAQANLAVNEARYNQAHEEYERNKLLFKETVISEQQFNNSKYAYEQALSAKKASQASVKNIQVSMSFAHITSPIDGTITERAVEERPNRSCQFCNATTFYYSRRFIENANSRRCRRKRYWFY